MNDDIQIVERKSENTLEIEARASTFLLPKVIGNSYKRIIEELEKKKIQPSGAPYVRYINLEWEELNGNKLVCFFKMLFKKWDILIGFPVSEKVQGVSEIKSSMLAEGRYVKCLHVGPYRNVGKTYERLISWIKEQNLKIKNESVEFYLNDPRTTKKEDLETLVFIPIDE